MRFLIIGSLFMLIGTACKQDVLNSAEWDMKDHQWLADDHKSFTLNATDTTTVYAMDITLTHDADYPYQNLYIKTQTVFPSGKVVESVSSLEMIGPDGNWAGDCSGQTCSLTLPLQHRFTFPEVGAYTWTVMPYMRMDTVMGIQRFEAICRKVNYDSK